MPNAKDIGRMAAKMDEADRESLKAAKVKAIKEDVPGKKSASETERSGSYQPRTGNSGRNPAKR